MSLRILITSRTTPFHSIGGMQSICWDLAREFARLGHHVTLLTTARQAGQATRTTLSDGVSVVFLGETTPEVYDRHWWAQSRQYVQLHLLNDVDAVLSVSAAAASLLKLTFPRRVPFIFQAHGTSWGEIVSKWSSRRVINMAKSVKNIYWLFKDATIYPRFDHVVAVGKGLGDSFQQAPLRWMTGQAKVSVILNGVDTSVFKPSDTARERVRAQLGIGTEERLVIFAARLHSQKGCLQAYEGFLRWRASSAGGARAKLLFVGGGEELQSLQQQARQGDAAASILFTGPVDRSDIPGLLAAADVFLFPTLRREGLPMNVLEALASGLPCVLSQGLREVLGDDLPAVYVNPQDATDIARALDRAANDHAPRQCELSEAYTLRHCAEQYIALCKA